MFDLRLALLTVAILPVSELAYAESGNEPPLSFGGPASISVQIENDRTVAEHQSRGLGFFERYLPWKDQLAEDTGFAYGVDYSTVTLFSSSTLPGVDDSAAGGVLRFFGSWKLFDGEGSQGELAWRLAHHHSYTDTAPLNFAIQNLGYAGLIDPLHDDQGFKVSNLYWKQSFANGRLLFLAGWHDVYDFAQTYAMTDPLKQFTNLAFLNGAGSIGAPPSGSLGVAGGGWISDQIYIQAGITDTNGDPTDPLEGFDTFFSDNEYFTHIEIGRSTSRDRFFYDNVHVNIWHSDARESTGTPSGRGIVFSFNHWVRDLYLPFFKAGFSDGGSGLYEASISAGLGYQPNPTGPESGNLLGVGFNWNRPNEDVFGTGLREQIAVETFYRWQATKGLAITGSVQYIKDPALNTAKDNLWAFNVRVRYAL